MNIFRLTGDLAHLIAIIILLQKIWHTRSCAGKPNFSVEPLFCRLSNTRYFLYLFAFLSFTRIVCNDDGVQCVGNDQYETISREKSSFYFKNPCINVKKKLCT